MCGGRYFRGMPSRLDWEKSNRQRALSRPLPVKAKPTDKPRGMRRTKESFDVIYARYAKTERESGRAPLPPLIWIKSLREAKRQAKIRQEPWQGVEEVD